MASGKRHCNSTAAAKNPVKNAVEQFGSELLGNDLLKTTVTTKEKKKNPQSANALELPPNCSEKTSGNRHANPIVKVPKLSTARAAADALKRCRSCSVNQPVENAVETQSRRLRF